MTDFIRISSQDLCVDISPYGAALARVYVKQHPTSLVLGLETAQDYAQAPDYIGVTVGPVAGRLGRARAPLNGKTLLLQPNEGENLLHSGPDAISHRLWDVVEHNENRAVLSCSLPDGACGLPGNRTITATYELNEIDLTVTFRAVSDADTLMSCVPHAYWCLDDSGSLADHHIEIFANAEIELGPGLLPTGNLLPIQAPLSREALAEPALDACFATPVSGMAQVAHVRSSRSGIALDVHSNQPGLVVYTGQFLTPTPAPETCPKIGPFSGIAIEPGGWPDAPNHPNFPQILLLRGEKTCQQTVYSLEMP